MIVIKHIDERKKRPTGKKDIVHQLQEEKQQHKKNKESSSHFKKQTKRSEQLETEKNELLFQIEKKKKTLQQASGNLY